MKITPEISFTLEFTEDEVTLLSNKFSAAYKSLPSDGWKDSFEMFVQRLIEGTYFDACFITLTLKEAKELMEDIADAGLCEEFDLLAPMQSMELWGALWNALKGY